MMQSSDWLMVALVVLLVAMPFISRWVKKRRGAYFRNKGRKGELAAKQLLRRHGYRIIDEQAQRPVVFYIDGERKEQMVSCDFIVRKGWRRYVVEVKSGKGSKATMASVRRQLFEYHAIYGWSGLLLVDMNDSLIHEIHFQQHRGNLYALTTLLGGMIGSGLCYYFFH